MNLQTTKPRARYTRLTPGVAVHGHGGRSYDRSFWTVEFMASDVRASSSKLDQAIELAYRSHLNRMVERSGK